LSITQSLGKRAFSDSLLGITPETAELSTVLFSDNNKNPADRIITAISTIENAKLVTIDKKLRQSRKVATNW